MLRLIRENNDSRQVRRVLAGQPDAYGLLVERYWSPACSIAAAILPAPADAEDVAQEAFVRAYQRLDQLTQHGKFGSWLFSIVRNTALSLRQQRQREFPLQGREVDEAAAASPGLEEELQLVRAALQRLEPQQREIILLHYYSHKSLPEAAALLEISSVAARKRLQRAREALGQELLARLGHEAAEVFQLDARKKRAVMAAVGAGTAWSASASAAGAGAALTLGFAAKLALAAVAAVAVGIGAVVTTVENNTAGNVGAVEQIGEQAPTPTSTTEGGEEPAEAAGGEVEETGTTAKGPGSVAGIIVDEDGRAVSGATASLELVTWKAMEMPPAKSQAWTTVSNEKGHFSFQELPLGKYGLLILAENGGGGDDFEITEKETELRNRRVELLPLPPVLDGFAGRVVDAAGNPVPHAVIYPTHVSQDPEEELNHVLVAQARAVTEADGTFKFARMLGGSWRFFVYAEGFAPLHTPFTSTADSPEFVMTPGGRIGGMVTRTDTGEPVANTEVTFTSGERLEYALRTDNNGVFDGGLFATEKYEAKLGDEVLVLDNPAPIEVVDGGAADVAFEALEGATVAGRLFNTRTGEGIGGIKLCVYSESRDRDIVTDANGNYIALGYAPGSVEMFFMEPTHGYYTTQTFRQLNVKAGENLEGVDFPFEPAAVIRGRALSADGNPVADAEIKIEQKTLNSYLTGKVRTKGDGSFVVDTIPEATTLALLAVGEQFQSTVHNFQAGEESDISLVLDRPATASVRGVVLASAGTPLMLDRLAFKLIPGEIEFPANIEGPGEFSIEGIQAGEYMLVAIAQMGGMSTYVDGLGDSVKVGDGEQKTLSPITIGGVGRFIITGRVVKPDGTPAARAEVSIPFTPTAVRADRKGFFKLENLTEGTHDLRAKFEGYAEAASNGVAAGSQAVELKLRNYIPLRGRLVNRDTQEPVAGADLSVSLWSMIMQSGNIISDEEGRFTFDEYVPGEGGVILLKAPGFVEVEWQFERYTEGTEMIVPLPPTGIVAGVVRDPEGNPLPGVNVTQSRIALDRQVISDGQGRFQVEDVPKGETETLFFNHPQYGTTTVPVTGGSPEAAALDVTLSRGPVLELIVTVDGEPADCFNYRCIAYQDNHLLHLVDEECVGVGGKHVVQKVAATTYALEVTKGIQRYETPVTFASGQTEVVRVDFTNGTSSVEGQITIAGAPAVAHWFNLTSTYDRHISFRKEYTKGSRFKLDRVPPGEYELLVTAELDNVRQARREPVTVLPGGTEIDIAFEGGATLIISSDEPGKKIAANLMRPDTPVEVLESIVWETTSPWTAAFFDADKVDSTVTFTHIQPGEYWLRRVPGNVCCPAPRNSPAPVARKITILHGENIVAFEDE